jgi:hypothetical protein
MGTPAEENATIELQQRNGVFYTVGASTLEKGQEYS